jgi:uncharacterized protein YijF (DUF1287 family)
VSRALAEGSRRNGRRTRRGTVPLGVVLLAFACGPALPARADFAARLVAAALARTEHEVRYDGSYRRIAYPGGDVPDSIGVCTDLIVRAYRAVGIDLQRAVHEDMRASFVAYPDRWGLTRPDPNIDHRRVPNLQTFFDRQGAALPVANDPADYLAGDLVTWRLPRGVPHIGLVTDRVGADPARRLVVHNIGAGPRLEDVLFAFEITGHYRYRGPAGAAGASSPPARIEDIAWIAGAWRCSALGGTAEETWSAPAGGSMMGMFRLYGEDGVSFYELMTISEQDGTLVLRLKHFAADLTGWEEKDETVIFPLVAVTPSAVQFDGLTFRREGDGGLRVFVSTEGRDGTRRELVFPYERIE